MTPFDQNVILGPMATSPTEPALHRHHGGRSWTSYWRDDAGKMHVHRLGKESDVGKREAKRRWQQWLDTEWKAHESVRNPNGVAAGFTCVRLAGKYLRHAGRVFRKHGKKTSHVTGVQYAMRALRDYCGDKQAERMESPDLAGLRDWMIMGTKGDQTYTRSITTVNGRLLIIKEAFAWAREKGLVTRAVALDLASVKPLAHGRSEAAPAKKIAPIAMAVVQATLPNCSSVVAAMIQVNLYAGTRPGEVCMMRGSDLEMIAEDCWLYRPESHKTEHKGKERCIALGPKAIAAIRPFLNRTMQAYLFSPSEARSDLYRRRQEQYAEARGGETSTHAEDVAAKLKQAPRRSPGRRYSEESYRKAIHYACKKAGIEPWGPNQLRHTHATEVRRVFGLEGLEDSGLEAAKETLGHSDTRTSEIYADPSVERAMVIARKVG